jgi:hypothetical protein
MTEAPTPTIRLVFTGSDPANPDPAAVGAAARNTAAGLRSVGETLTPAYTGEKDAGTALQWLFDAAVVTSALIALPDFALKVAQLLNEIRKLSGVDQANPQAPTHQPITLVIRVEQAAATLQSDTVPDDAALLADLLGRQLPAAIDPASTTIEVQIPPTPPVEL